jgi:hypothetical protein
VPELQDEENRFIGERRQQVDLSPNASKFNFVFNGKPKQSPEKIGRKEKPS